MPWGSDALEAYLLDGECVKKWGAGAVSQVTLLSLCSPSTEQLYQSSLAAWPELWLSNRSA